MEKAVRWTQETGAVTRLLGVSSWIALRLDSKNNEPRVLRTSVFPRWDCAADAWEAAAKPGTYHSEKWNRLAIPESKTP